MSSFRRRLMMAQQEDEKLQDYFVYTTTSANQSVQIIFYKEYAQRIYLEDGTELDVSGSGALSYTFPEIGDHKVWIELKPELTYLGGCFGYCSNLKTIPCSLFKNNTNNKFFSFCFDGCSMLEKIPEGLFRYNKNASYFDATFGNCNLLSGETPKDEDGGELWERAGKEGYPSNIIGNECFYGCTLLSNYTSIPDDWK